MKVATPRNVKLITVLPRNQVTSADLCCVFCVFVCMCACACAYERVRACERAGRMLYFVYIRLSFFSFYIFLYFFALGFLSFAFLPEHDPFICLRIPFFSSMCSFYLYFYNIATTTTQGNNAPSSVDARILLLPPVFSKE